LAKLGGRIVDNPADLAGVDVLFTIVSTGSDLEEVYFGDNGIVTQAKGTLPKIFVDCSTIAVEDSAHIAARLEKCGVDFVSAPVSGNALVINSFSKYFCMTGWRVGWMVVPEPLVRTIERLQQNLSISVPTLSQIAAEAAFEGREEMEAIKRGYQENRRILIEGLPKAGLTKFLPADGAFYLYADVSDFTADSFEFAGRMLEKAHVAATPGVDFDPIHGRSFIRFSYARSADEMREAVTRIARWLR